MEASDIFAVLGDPNRRRLLSLVEGGERSVGDLVRTTRLRQPLVSHHLRVLRDAGLVQARREGRFRFYRASQGEVAKLLQRLDEVAKALGAAGEANQEASQAGGPKPGAVAATHLLWLKYTTSQDHVTPVSGSG